MAAATPSWLSIRTRSQISSTNFSPSDSSHELFARYSAQEYRSSRSFGKPIKLISESVVHGKFWTFQLHQRPSTDLHDVNHIFAAEADFFPGRVFVTGGAITGCATHH